MLPVLKITMISSILLLSLSACSTVPNSSTLMSGIDEAQLSKVAPDTVRAASDPVCVSFYENAKTYIAQANKPNPGQNFMKSLGISVLAGVVTGGLVPAGLGSVGQVAASQAVSTTVTQGSGMALQGLKSNSPVSAKITEAAAEIGCPMSIAT